METQTTEIKQKRKYTRKSTNEVDSKTTVKELTAELNLANNKIEEYKKIIENLKTQNSQFEQRIKNILIRNKAEKEYMLDCIKHAYISVSMSVKDGE